jgi:hypothetical protein
MTNYPSYVLLKLLFKHFDLEVLVVVLLKDVVLSFDLVEGFV